jgi:hypothetical protein
MIAAFKSWIASERTLRFKHRATLGIFPFGVVSLLFSLNLVWEPRIALSRSPPLLRELKAIPVPGLS